MSEALIFLIIFGVLLLLAAAGLWFSKDPRKSFLLYKVAGLQKKSPEEAQKTAKQIGASIAGVGLALIVFCGIKFLGGS